MAESTSDTPEPQDADADLRHVFDLAQRLYTTGDGDKDQALDRFEIAMDLSKAALRVERGAAERAREVGVTWKQLAELAGIPLATMHARLRVTKGSKIQSYGGLGHHFGRGVDRGVDRGV
jgi:hypothetical protein